MRYVQYQFAHRRPMSVAAMAQLLGNTLYYKRFFPYYTFNLCAGLDAEGAPLVINHTMCASCCPTRAAPLLIMSTRVWGRALRMRGC